MKRLLAVALLLLAACGDEAPKQAVQTDQPAPPFAARSLSGETMEIPAGQVVVVRFWASWCSFCKEEMKSIEPVWRANRDKGLLVLAVNAGQSREDIEKFIAPFGLTYPILLDPGSKIARAWGVTGLPMTVFIGRDGRVKHRVLGESTPETFRNLVEGLL